MSEPREVFPYQTFESHADAMGGRSGITDFGPNIERVSDEERAAAFEAAQADAVTVYQTEVEEPDVDGQVDDEPVDLAKLPPAEIVETPATPLPSTGADPGNDLPPAI